MAIGPVEFLVVGFPENRFTGEIAPALRALVDAKTIRIIDLAFVAKDAQGSIIALELDDLESEVGKAFAALGGGNGGLLNEDNILEVGDALEPRFVGGRAGLGGPVGDPLRGSASWRRRRPDRARADPA